MNNLSQILADRTPEQKRFDTRPRAVFFDNTIIYSGQHEININDGGKFGYKMYLNRQSSFRDIAEVGRYYDCGNVIISQSANVINKPDEFTGGRMFSPDNETYKEWVDFSFTRNEFGEIPMVKFHRSLKILGNFYKTNYKLDDSIVLLCKTLNDLKFAHNNLRFKISLS